MNREALGIEWLGIAHVHHGLREGTADRDASFVEAFARKYDVPFFLKKLDGEALKNAEGSLEENARDARYQVLENVANANKCTIVTAHHAGDQAETMYMRLRRGTTLAGLRGIQALRQAQGPFIYRPFLSVTREELLEYARENKLSWCEDESNADMKFARNFIRHKAIPHLEETLPGAMEQLCRIAGLADKAYAKVLEKCGNLFAGTMGSDPEASSSAGIMTITLDKKALRKVLLAHEKADLSELFRLWLSAQGLRFPIGFFYGPKEPAHVKIPHHAVYRKRSIAKMGQSIRICEFCTPDEAQKFVSCGMKEKGL